MRRVGVFGGTFNPVHNGHLRLAEHYIKSLPLDRLLVVPSHTPPHKADDGLISGAHRLAMCRLAFAGWPDCEVSELELCRAQKSYTVDTLEQLRGGEYREDELYLIMGSDMFFTMTQWRSWQRIFQLAVLCVGAREPALRGRLLDAARELEQLGAQCRVIDTKPFVVSSTELRLRAGRGEPLDGDLPPAVAAYIRQNGLYRR